jgi:hypothetical protein
MSETSEPSEPAEERPSRWRALRPNRITAAVLTVIGAVFVGALVFGGGVLVGAELGDSEGDHHDSSEVSHHGDDGGEHHGEGRGQQDEGDDDSTG